MKIKKIVKKVSRYLMSPEEYAKSIGVKLGKNVYLSTKEFPNEGYLIEIGDCVRVAYGTSFYTHGGLWSLRKYYKNPNLEQFGKIKIGDYTSIGAHCLIMPGVTIGERCIVAGGSVVTKSVPDGCMVAGNPAKFIGYTEDFYNKVSSRYNLDCKNMSEIEKMKYLMTLSDDSFVKKGVIKIPEK